MIPVSEPAIMPATTSHEKRIAKLRPGRELLIVPPPGSELKALRLQIRAACERVSKINGQQFKLLRMPRGILVRCANDRIDTPASISHNDKTARSWLLEHRLGKGRAREFRIEKAWNCLLKIKGVTRENVNEIVARLEFTVREIMLLRENEFMTGEFGLIDPEIEDLM